MWAAESELGVGLLRSVSRSFYLTIRFLPGGFREPVALAYLLARATDTVADTAEIDAAERLELLLAMRKAIAGESGESATAQLRKFAALQRDVAEKKLIEQWPLCLEWLHRIESPDRMKIREVLATITRGQELDLRRFGDASRIATLATAEELDEYTYLVAGCVGKFWTDLGFEHLRNFSSQPRDAMNELGIAYGQGLQLINILRDAGADLKSGRCYFPEGELDATILESWRQKAEQRVAAGIEYACAVRNFRTRFATALPALIGARTLSLLRKAGATALERRVKISRAEVRETLLAAFVASRSAKSLRALFERYKK